MSGFMMPGRGPKRIPPGLENFYSGKEVAFGGFLFILFIIALIIGLMGKCL